MDLESNRLHRNTNPVSEIPARSEMTNETTIMNNDEKTNQVTRRLDEVRFSLTSQILEAINSAITEKVLPTTIQNTPSK